MGIITNPTPDTRLICQRGLLQEASELYGANFAKRTIAAHRPASRFARALGTETFLSSFLSRQSPLIRSLLSVRVHVYIHIDATYI